MLAISEFVGLFLVVKLVRSRTHWATKPAYSVVLLVPIVGPAIYFFLREATPPQSPDLMNTGPRSDYLHRWLSVAPLLRRAPRAMPTPTQKSDAGAGHSD